MSKPPNTRARQRLVQILTHLAEFAEISVDLSLYKGNYSCAKSQPREIPTDPEILVTRNKITNLQCRLVFDRMAVYGLRDHECWHCEIDRNPPHACSLNFQAISFVSGDRKPHCHLFAHQSPDLIEGGFASIFITAVNGFYKAIGFMRPPDFDSTYLSLIRGLTHNGCEGFRDKGGADRPGCSRQDES